MSTQAVRAVLFQLRSILRTVNDPSLRSEKPPQYVDGHTRPAPPVSIPAANREALAASLATAKSELEKTRRLAREAAEAGRNDAEGALEKQVGTSLHRRD